MKNLVFSLMLVAVHGCEKPQQKQKPIAQDVPVQTPIKPDPVQPAWNPPPTVFSAEFSGKVQEANKNVKIAVNGRFAVQDKLQYVFPVEVELPATMFKVNLSEGKRYRVSVDIQDDLESVPQAKGSNVVQDDGVLVVQDANGRQLDLDFWNRWSEASITLEVVPSGTYNIFLASRAGTKGTFVVKIAELPPHVQRPMDRPIVPVYIPPARLTMAKFNQIRDFSTYAEVVKVLGKEGTLSSRTVFGGQVIEFYNWEQSDIFAVITVGFENGIATTKVQIGLK